MNFSKIERFTAKEFPSRHEINLTDPQLFYTLDAYAKELDAPVYPSPAKGALARTIGSKTSRHYAVGRLSTAVDFFSDCNPLKAFLIALMFFGGVGVYFDTHYKGKPWIMLHGDLRNVITMWWREDHKYHNVTSLNDLRFLIEKLKGGWCDRTKTA